MGKPIANYALRSVIAVAVLAILIASAIAGMQLRSATFEFTQPIRFGGDLRNAYQHGRNVIRLAREQNDLPRTELPTWRQTFVAYLGFYDRVLGGWPQPGYELDYPPLRLAIMTTWTRAIEQPGQRTIPDELPACGPLLTLNAIVAGVTAVLAAMLVRHWLRRARPDAPAIVRPLVAALLVWFDFALLIDAHAWPQWDVWPLPFFMGAMLAGSHRRWLAAGIIFGLGLMLKGQMALVAPLLVLWPMLGAQWRGTAAVIVGLMSAVAIVEAMYVTVAPWSIAGAATVLLALAVARWYWPTFWRGRLVLMIAIAAAGVLAAAYLGGASFGWIAQGFVHGVESSTDRLARTGANNLGQLLQITYRYDGTTDPLLNWPTPITAGQCMKAAYAIGIALSAAALARHDRRSDVRALAAMVTPWLLLYALLPQLSGRYLMWAATSSAVLIGIGVGPALLHGLISIAAGVTILHVMILYSGNADWWPALSALLDGMHPGTAWLTLLLAGVMLYLSLTPTPVRSDSSSAP